MQQTSSSAPPLIAFQNVSKVYEDGQVRALDGVSLAIRPREFVSVTGPSGCGKSTLLNIIGGLDRATSGNVQIRGHALDAMSNLDHFRAQEIGFVFQSFHLLPNLTAEENVQIPMFESELRRGERVARSRDLLGRVGLADRFRHLPRQLSIGQRQRVAVARAIANEPAIVLADEPTGSLDTKSGNEVLELLAQLNEQLGTTLLVVTHDATLASRAARTISMKDGRIE